MSSNWSLVAGRNSLSARISKSGVPTTRAGKLATLTSSDRANVVSDEGPVRARDAIIESADFGVQWLIALAVGALPISDKARTYCSFAAVRLSRVKRR
ncbi:hypothetical protein D3C71_1969820 [compost metagenome]